MCGDLASGAAVQFSRSPGNEAADIPVLDKQRDKQVVLGSFKHELPDIDYVVLLVR